MRIPGRLRLGTGLTSRRCRDREVAGPERHATAFDEGADPERRRQVGRCENRIKVAGRRREVAAPPMDATECDLDSRELVGRCQRRRCLEGRDRGRVLAQARSKLADPCMDRRGVGPSQRKRGF